MTSPRRNIATIIPAGITFLAFAALLTVARFYEHLPMKPPPCGFRKIVGIPCLGCGGTRCMMALSRGEIVKSFLFNPAIFIGLAVIVVWFVSALVRYFKQTGGEHLKPQSRNRRLFQKWFFTVGIPFLLLLNWIYLAMYLPK